MRAAQRYYQTTFFYIGDKIVGILLLLYGVYSMVTAGVHWLAILFIALAPCEWFNLLSTHRLKAYLGSKWNPKFREQFEVTFTQQGIHFSTPTIDSHIDWTFYHYVLEDDQLFLLVYGKWMYSVIPKRAFANASERDAFRDLMRQMIVPLAKQVS
jgi:hypothetical protein